MGLLPVVSGNPNSKAYALLILGAVIVFLLGLLTSPLLQSNNPTPLAHLPSPIRKFKATDTPTAPWLPSTEHPPSDLMTFPSQCPEPISSSLVKGLVLAKVFDGISPFAGFPPEYAKPWLREKRFLGWGSYDKVFERLITEVKPKIILELGTFLGASATHMATLSKSQGREVLILCADDFRGWPGFRDEVKLEQIHGDVQLFYHFLQNVQELNLTESILPVPFSTSLVMYALCRWGVYADLIEVDAGHDFHSAWIDINCAHMVLRPGGVMFGDDYYNVGVGRAVDLFAKVNGLRVEPDGRHWILRSRSVDSDIVINVGD